MGKDLGRFLMAQEGSYEQALFEIKSGNKRSHWMWFIFPQFKGLGYSERSKYYAINDLEEARSYLYHPILGLRLRSITKELLVLNENNAHKVFGNPDDVKLKSSMTLFAAIDSSQPSIFKLVLEKYFQGETDEKTLTLIKQ
jgi:uncharacterized protein (DUF1810 family)